MRRAIEGMHGALILTRRYCASVSTEGDHMTLCYDSLHTDTDAHAAVRRTCKSVALPFANSAYTLCAARLLHGDILLVAVCARLTFHCASPETSLEVHVVDLNDLAHSKRPPDMCTKLLSKFPVEAHSFTELPLHPLSSSSPVHCLITSTQPQGATFVAFTVDAASLDLKIISKFPVPSDSIGTLRTLSCASGTDAASVLYLFTDRTKLVVVDGEGRVKARTNYAVRANTPLAISRSGSSPALPALSSTSLCAL